MYCSHFGLHRPPFNNTPDPAFYYCTPDHEEALATLQYATQERKGFVLVTGEVGAGKTLMARMYCRAMESQANIATISQTQLNGRQLLSAICNEFELYIPPDATNLQLTEALQRYLLEQFAQDRFVTVILDEAQNLPDESFETIRMLGNLEADDAKLLQVCIIGQPELRHRFSQSSMTQLDQRLFCRFHLPALTREQAAEYINRRLQVAGAKPNRQIFTPESIDRIYQISEGIPRLINRLCDNAMLTAYAQGRKVVDEEIIEEIVSRDVLPSPSTSSNREAAADNPVPERTEQGQDCAPPQASEAHQPSSEPPQPGAETSKPSVPVAEKACDAAAPEPVAQQNTESESDEIDEATFAETSRDSKRTTVQSQMKANASATATQSAGSPGSAASPQTRRISIQLDKAPTAEETDARIESIYGSRPVLIEQPSASTAPQVGGSDEHTLQLYRQSADTALQLDLHAKKTQQLSRQVDALSESSQAIRTQLGVLIPKQLERQNSFDQVVTDLQEQTSQAQSEIDRLAPLQEMLQEDQKDVRNRLAELQDKQNQLATTLNQATSAIGQLGDENAEQRDRLKSRLDRVHAELNEKHVALTQKLEDRADLMATLIQGCHEKIDPAMIQLESVTADHDNLQSEQAEINAQVQEAIDALTAATQELSTRMDGAEPSVKALQETCRTLESQQADWSEAFNNLEDRMNGSITTLQQELHRLKADQEQTRQHLSRISAAAESTQHEILAIQEAQQNLATQLESASANWGGTQEALQRLQNEQQQLGREVENIVRTVTELTDKLQATHESMNNDEAAARERAELHRALDAGLRSCRDTADRIRLDLEAVQPEQEALRDAHAVLKEKVDHGLDVLNRGLNQLEADQEQTRQHLSRIGAAAESAQNEILAIQEAQRDLASQLASARVNWGGTQEALQRLHDEQQQLGREVESIVQTVAELTDKLQATHDDSVQHDEAATRERAELQRALDTGLRSCRETADRIRVDLEAVHPEQEALRDAHDALKEKVDHGLDVLNRGLKRIEDTFGSMQTDQRELRQRQDALEAAVTQAVGDFEVTSEQLRDELNQLQPRQDELESLVSGATSQWLNTKGELDTCRNELQTSIEQVTARCQSVAEQMAELSQRTSSLERLEEIRREHMSETTQTLAEIAQQRAHFQQLLEQAESRWVETRRHVMQLLADNVDRATVEGLKTEFEQRIRELAGQMEHHRGHINYLVQRVQTQCDQMEQQMDYVQSSQDRTRVELTQTLQSTIDHTRKEVDAKLQETAKAKELEALREQHEEAQNRLRRKIEEDVSALQSTVGDLERQLKDQSANAHAEFESLAARLEVHRHEIETIHEQVEKRLISTRNALDHVSHNVESVAETAASNDALHELWDEHRSSVRNVLQRIEKQAQHLSELNETLDTAALARIGDHDSTIAALSHDVAEFQNQLVRLRHQLARFHVNVRSRLNNLAKDFARRDELETLRNEQQAHLERTDAHVAELGRHKADRSELNEVHREAVSHSQQVSAQLESTHNELAANVSQVDELRTARDDHDRSLQNHNERLDRHDEQIDSLDARKAEREEVTEDIVRLQHRIEASGQATREQFDVVDRLCQQAEQAVGDLRNQKADRTELEEVAQSKADRSELDACIAVKADRYELERIDQSKLDKTEAAELDSKKPDRHEVENALASKADRTETERLDKEKADRTTVETSLDAKADKEEIEHLESAKAERSDLIRVAKSKADRTELVAYDQKHEKAIARLLEQLETQERQLTDRLVAATSKWRETRDELDRLAEDSATKDMVESLRDKQVRDSQDMLAALESHRSSLTDLIRKIDEECRETIDLHKNELEEGIAWVSQQCLQAEAVIESLKETGAKQADVDQLRAGKADHAEVEALREQQEAEAQQLLASMQQYRTELTELTEQVARQQAESAAARRNELESVVAHVTEQIDQTRQALRHLEDSTASAEDLELLRKTAADARGVEVLRERHAAEIQALRETLTSQRKEMVTLLGKVHRRCNEMLKVHQAEWSTALEELTRRHSQDVEQIHHRLAEQQTKHDAQLVDLNDRWNRLRGSIDELAATAVPAQKFEAAEQSINYAMENLHKHLGDLSGRQRQDTRTVVDMIDQMVSRLQQLEEAERPRPVEIRLRPNEAEELADATTAACEATKQLDKRIELLSALESRLDSTASRVEEIMQNWMSTSGRVEEQSDRLRSSAEVSANILKALQKCQENVNGKLNSDEWRREMKRVADLTQRLEEAADDAEELKQELHDLLREGRAAGSGFAKMISNIARNSSGLAEIIGGGMPDPESSGHASRSRNGRKRSQHRDAEAVDWQELRTHSAEVKAS